MSVRETLARPRSLVAAREWHFPALVGVVCLVITALPYVVGSLFSWGGQQFMGIASDVPDTAQYLAWMRAFAHSDGLLISNPLTPEPNRAAFFNLLWYALGHAAQWINVPPMAAYQAFRWGAGAGFLVVLWIACGVFCTPGWERRLAWLLVTLAGGFGWVWVILKYVVHRQVPPLDIYVAEPNTFLALIGYPHLVLAAMLILGVFLLTIRGYERGSGGAYLGAAVLALLIGVTHAYDLIIVYAVLAGFVAIITARHRAIPWRLVGGVTAIGALSSPPALYFTYLTEHDPTWRGVLAQYGNAGVVTPSPLHLAILLGPVFLVALLAIDMPAGWRVLWSGPERDLLIGVWFLVSFPLVYLPTPYQIKMLNGWQIPAGILAARLVVRLIGPRWEGIRATLRGRRISVSAGVLAGLVLLGLAMPTNLYLVAWRADELHRHVAPYSLSAGDVAALQWLGEHADTGDVVLSSLTVGQYIAMFSSARPIIAHWAQTLDYFDKEGAVRQFFDAGTADEDRTALLRRWHIVYVVAGPEERALGDFSPAQSPQFSPVFSSGQTTIYAVRPAILWSA
jgi:hypothetical protein